MLSTQRVEAANDISYAKFDVEHEFKKRVCQRCGYVEAHCPDDDRYH